MEKSLWSAAGQRKELLDLKSPSGRTRKGFGIEPWCGILRVPEKMTCDGYYTSKTGIGDLEYIGNVMRSGVAWVSAVARVRCRQRTALCGRAPTLLHRPRDSPESFDNCSMIAHGGHGSGLEQTKTPVALLASLALRLVFETQRNSRKANGKTGQRSFA